MSFAKAGRCVGCCRTASTASSSLISDMGSLLSQQPGERTAGSAQTGFHGSWSHVQRFGDLVDVEPAKMVHDDRLPLSNGQLAQCPSHVHPIGARRRLVGWRTMTQQRAHRVTRLPPTVRHQPEGDGTDPHLRRFKTRYMLPPAEQLDESLLHTFLGLRSTLGNERHHPNESAVTGRVELGDCISGGGRLAHTYFTPDETGWFQDHLSWTYQITYSATSRQQADIASRWLEPPALAPRDGLGAQGCPSWHGSLPPR